MARKQMLGIQERAERVARESLVLTSFATTMGQRPTTEPKAVPVEPSTIVPPEASKPEEPEIRVKFKVQDLVSKAEPPAEPTAAEANETEPAKA